MKLRIVLATACVAAVGGVTGAAIASSSSNVHGTPPAGASVPTNAGSQQFGFGNCDARAGSGEYGDAGWVCVDDAPSD